MSAAIPVGEEVYSSIWIGQDTDTETRVDFGGIVAGHTRGLALVVVPVEVATRLGVSQRLELAGGGEESRLITAGGLCLPAEHVQSRRPSTWTSYYKFPRADVKLRGAAVNVIMA